MQMYAALAAVLRANTVKLRRDRTGARAGLATALKGCTRRDAAAIGGRGCCLTGSICCNFQCPTDALGVRVLHTSKGSKGTQSKQIEQKDDVAVVFKSIVSCQSERHVGSYGAWRQPPCTSLTSLAHTLQPGTLSRSVLLAPAPVLLSGCSASSDSETTRTCRPK